MITIKDVGRICIDLWLSPKTRFETDEEGTLLRINLPYPMGDVTIIFNEKSETITVEEFKEKIVAVLDEMIRKRKESKKE